MRIAPLEDADLNWREEGDPEGPAVVFANSLGTDLRLWDKVVKRLPGHLRLIRYDKRGHGLSSAPPAPYSMGSLVTDAERLIEHAEAAGCVFVGLSIGGLIAQGLGAKRPDLISGMVLANTAVKIGTRDSWDERIATIRAHGIDAIADATMEKWFTPAFRDTPDCLAWRNMLTRQPLDGYAGCCAAIGGTDFLSTTSTLGMPVLCIAGDHDGATPPDVVREMHETAPDSRYHLIHGAGHLPPVETPDEFTAVLLDFLEEIGHA